MPMYRAFAGLTLGAAALALLGCQRQPPAPPPPAQESPAADSAWFICDALNAPRIIVARKSEDGADALVTMYEKPGAVPALRANLKMGAPEGAAGHIETELTRDGEPRALVRETNPGMLETPGAAYTPVIRDFAFGDDHYDCRWMPRTRMSGFSEQRFFVVHEDADGDLILSVYDLNATARPPIDLEDNAHTTQFNLEIRDGKETVGPGGSEFRFERGGDLYLLVAPNAGQATYEVWHLNVQSGDETLIAFEVGTGPSE